MSHLSRRDALRYGAAAAAAATGVAGAQALSTSDSTGQALAAPAPNRDPRDFDLQYRGKSIRGVHGGAVAGIASQRRRQPHQVFVNGRKLAVMEIELPAAGGGVTVGYISAINHYEPVLIDTGRNNSGLLKLAKRAVDVLGDTELTAVAGEHHDHGR